MSKSFSGSGKTGRGWRLLAEIVQPTEWQDERWVAIGLTSALDAIGLPAPDIERLENATVEAVIRTRRCLTTPDRVPQRVVVRVLLSAPVEARTATFGWGFFIIERVDGAMDGTDPDADGVEGCPGTQVIELCLYADAAAA